MKFVELDSSKSEVIEAREYQRYTVHAQLHPFVSLKEGKNNFTITDRYILYRLLSRIDPELRYLDMMHTLYGMTIEERPSIGDIIQGYLTNYSGKIGVWIDDDEIVMVDGIETESRYHFTTMDYIGANFLPDYTRSTRSMKYGPKERYRPVMVFTKDNIKIEILSGINTYIVGRYRTKEGVWVQPRPVGFCPRWAHLIPHTALKVMLDDFRVLDSMDELTKAGLEVFGGGVSDRLVKWEERNRLEAENMFRFNRKTIAAINSFCFEEE